jgi:hypothetical protein
MKKAVVLAGGLLLATLLPAQTLAPMVIASAGGYDTTVGASLSYTVGELAAVQTFTNSSNILTQGFQQPSDILSGLLDIQKDAQGAFSVYPVPASATFWYGYEFYTSGRVEIHLLNILGQRLESMLAEEYDSGKKLHSFDCTAYAAGNYILMLEHTDAGGRVTTLSRKVTLISK